jgi:hypothetical protein
MILSDRVHGVGEGMLARRGAARRAIEAIDSAPRRTVRRVAATIVSSKSAVVVPSLIPVISSTRLSARCRRHRLRRLDELVQRRPRAP